MLADLNDALDARVDTLSKVWMLIIIAMLYFVYCG